MANKATVNIQLDFGFNNKIESPELGLLSKSRSLDAFANNSYSPSVNQTLTEFAGVGLANHPEYAIAAFPDNLVAGKNTYTYDAHTYHTKVPPEAIVRLIEFYTEPGDIVLDPFCGSGMTGVAALRTGRKPILADLSPAATFIALNFLTPIDARKYIETIETILTYTHDEEMMLYGTHCRDCGKLVPMEYMVWSYGLICQFCQKEFMLWEVARDERPNVRESKIKTEFDCPHCGKHLQKRTLDRTKLYPVQVGYRCCNSRLQEAKSTPDEYDLNVIRNADNIGIPQDLWYPTANLPEGINTRQAIAHGLDSVRSLYTTRNLWAIARLWDIACRWQHTEIALKLMFTVTSLYQRVTRLSEFRFWGGSGNIANYNVPMVFNEQNVFKVFKRKAKTVRDYLETWNVKPTVPFCISTQSATNLQLIPDNSIDYIFTDPPFGSNINYSEMNFIWESWLGTFTNTKNEAIINRAQGKTIEEYRELMTQALREMRRVLKPGKWLSLEFHNSSAEVWATIQTALGASGFEIRQTQILDKRHGTFKQFVSENAVGYDLILHCTTQIHSIAAIPIKGSGQSIPFPSLRKFLERILRQNSDELTVQYLHVKRQNELDTRKLYSLWLKERMVSGTLVDMDYEHFRQMTSQMVQLDQNGHWTVKAEQ